MSKLIPKISSVSAMVRFVEQNCSADNILFRGQSGDHPLLPKIARANYHPRQNQLKDERRMFDEFIRQAPPYLEIEPKSQWEWLAIAQHHGMATRLLDWSLNPLAALWFTVQQPAVDANPGVVWLFEAKDDDFIDPSSGTDPLSIDRTKVFRPRHLTRRIVAQSGWFTAHKYLDRQNRFVPLNKNASYRSRLEKLTIPASKFSDIRRELDRCGINGASLYGGIDGLCRHIEWLHSFLPDEIEAGKPRAS